MPVGEGIGCVWARVLGACGRGYWVSVGEGIGYLWARVWARVLGAHGRGYWVRVGEGIGCVCVRVLGARGYWVRITCRRLLALGEVEAAARTIHQHGRHVVVRETHRAVAHGPVVGARGRGREGVGHPAPANAVPTHHVPPRVPEGLLVWGGSRERAFMPAAAWPAHSSTWS